MLYSGSGKRLFDGIHRGMLLALSDCVEHVGQSREVESALDKQT